MPNKCEGQKTLAWIGFALAALSATAFAAGTNSPGSASGDVLLLDSLGRVVAVPTNEVPSALRPTTGAELQRQIPWAPAFTASSRLRPG